MKKIKVGILGVGGRGKVFHKNVLANNGEIVAACDVCEEYLAKAKENGEIRSPHTLILTKCLSIRTLIWWF
jgi:predicted dehydrogenase